MNDTVISKRKKLQRVGAEDFSFCEEALKTAEILIVPEDQTQRAAFEKLMPHLYVLRNKGCSWSQLTTLLNKSGFKLQPSTVRSYYSEMLLKSMNQCQARMNQQVDLMRKLREENALLAGGDQQLAALAQRINSQMSKVQQSNSARVNEMFGLDPVLPPPATIAQPAATPSKVAPSKPAKAIVPASNHVATPLQAPAQPTFAQQAPEESPTNDEFGLLGLGRANHSTDSPAGFFSLDTEKVAASGQPVSASLPASPTRSASAPDTHPVSQPVVHTTQSHAQPVTGKQPHQEPGNNVIKKRCAPLNSNIAPMKKRDNVPKEVYEPGQMEHPAIPGLMLSMEERMYGAGLEYCDEYGDEAGVYRTETADEKRFRVTWRKVVPITPTRTADTFMKMDTSLFKNQS